MVKHLSFSIWNDIDVAHLKVIITEAARCCKKVGFPGTKISRNLVQGGILVRSKLHIVKNPKLCTFVEFRLSRVQASGG